MLRLTSRVVVVGGRPSMATPKTAPAIKLAASVHWRALAPATSRRVRRTQSRGASRAVSMTWPRTCTVMAPNHSTKLALWRNSSEWRSECGAISSPMPLARRTTVRMTICWAEEPQQRRWGAFAAVGRCPEVVTGEAPAGRADFEQHGRYQRHSDKHVQAQPGPHPHHGDALDSQQHQKHRGGGTGQSGVRFDSGVGRRWCFVARIPCRRWRPQVPVRGMPASDGDGRGGSIDPGVIGVNICSSFTLPCPWLDDGGLTLVPGCPSFCAFYRRRARPRPLRRGRRPQQLIPLHDTLS